MDKILIIQTAFLGDVILATALAETLHLHKPAAEIDILVKKQNASLFVGHKFFRNVLLFDKKKGKISETIKLLRQIRRNKYNAVINIHRFFSSGLLTVLSGANIRAGFSKNPLSVFYTHKTEHIFKDNLHEIERNLKLIAFTGINKTLLPRLYVSESDIKAVAKYKETPYICIVPASIWYTKQYPVLKWAELLSFLPRKFKIYILGSDKDLAICNEIIRISHNKNIINLSGKLSLLQTASLMKDALMNYVNDSAASHIASAVNAPVTTIFCSTIPQFGFGPLSDNSAVVETYEKLLCRPCGLHGLNKCPEKHFKCAYTIDNNILLQKVYYNQEIKSLKIL